MDTPQDEAGALHSFREDVRAFIQANLPLELRERVERGWGFLSKEDYVFWQKRLQARGWGAPGWPLEYGGTGWTAAQRQVYEDESALACCPRTQPQNVKMIGPILCAYGSEHQRRRFLPGILSGDEWWCQGYSEPGAGSDLASLRTRAVLAGDDAGEYYSVSGQKMWTSQGHFADYCLMLVRTGEGKHNGITLFALPIKDCAGFACNEIKTVGNERTNATFYDNVRISDEYRLGEVNGGAKVLGAALAMEQGSADHFVGAIKMMLEGGLEWAKAAQRNGRRAIDDPATRAVLASVATRLEVTDALSRRTTWSGSVGKAQKHFGPAAKLFGSEAWVSCSTDLMAMAAPDTLLQGYTDTGRIERQFRRAVPSTIYAGSSEVQRSIVAEAGLGLPRTRS